MQDSLGAAPTHPSPCTEGPFQRSPEDVLTHHGDVTGDRGEEQEQPCWECRECPCCGRAVVSSRGWQLIAIYDEQETPPKTDGTNGNVTNRNSPDSFETEVATQLAAFQPIGEIEVTPSALKLGIYESIETIAKMAAELVLYYCFFPYGQEGASTNLFMEDPFYGQYILFMAEEDGDERIQGTPLLVRRSSDPALGAPADFPSASQPSDHGLKHVVALLPRLSSHLPGLTPAGYLPLGWWDRPVGFLLPGWFPAFLPSHLQVTEEKGASQASFQDGEMNLTGPTELLLAQRARLPSRMLGLFIRGIEENSRSRRDDLFHENECIVKINHVDLTDKTFAQAQDIFRQAMKFQSVILEVLPPYNREQYEKSAIAPLCILNNEEGVTKTKIPPPLHPKPAVKTVNISGAILESGVQGALQQAKSPNLPRLGRKPSSPSLSPLMGFGNKRNAKKIKIDLKKGPEGLGFTVVTRDSSVHGPGPIFVKNILPKGAAVKDGRLQSGDRILEVNGRDITGRTQEELVAMLRSTKQGETVCLIVARQEEAFLPRELKGEPNCSIFSPETTEQLTFEIPLNDSGSAGLGVSLKGNKSRETGADLGIFIKSVIHGGAAFKDGRLRVNDQLVAVNGESLLGKSNHEAMETLRRSMSMEGNIRGRIQLVVLRRLEVHTEERSDQGVFQKSAFDGSHNFTAASRRNETVLQQFVTCSAQEGVKEFLVSDRGSGENETPPPLPPHPSEDLLNEDYNHSPIINSAVHLTDQHINFRSLTPAKQSESINLKASKSMDLVADESKVGLLAGHKSGCNAYISNSSGKDFGPTLGLKKSSSLESLQTAVAEVRKNELPFHRPRPHVVRGRGCNESFRAAIDKSYDGPEDGEEDGGSDKSSHCGQEAHNVESAPPGNPEIADAEIKAKKDKKSREKEKKKGKSKIKEKKKKEENEDPEKKKKKGFGVMLRTLLKQYVHTIVKDYSGGLKLKYIGTLEYSEVVSCRVEDPGSPGFSQQQVQLPQGSSSAASRRVGGERLVGFPPISLGSTPADCSGAALHGSFQGFGFWGAEVLGCPGAAGCKGSVGTIIEPAKANSNSTLKIEHLKHVQKRKFHLFQYRLASVNTEVRFGKKKEDKSGKADQKGTPKQGVLKEEELEKMKDERESNDFNFDLEEFVTEMENSRIGAKHQELRQKQLRGLSDYCAGPGGPDIDDDEVDPNYARVNHFREVYPPGSIYRPSSPAAGETFVYLRDSSSAPLEREHLEGLYAKINKQHYPQTSGDRAGLSQEREREEGEAEQSASPSKGSKEEIAVHVLRNQVPNFPVFPVCTCSGCTGGGNADRIQRLRKEYQQARREGLPFYEGDDGRTQLPDYDQRWRQRWLYGMTQEGVETQPLDGSKLAKLCIRHQGVSMVPGKGPDGSSYNLHFEGVERQYASLPRICFCFCVAKPFSSEQVNSLSQAAA
ncbi:hypothetical protein DV515_00008335 [Chloebia gouldiae]|uniref:PDZ domain-containing protein n=1 Tax=Chloebia gouldiae TaxID=44316 RepID=A0A3L8SFW3_CHLGU|nr:hypothetical protein DV515_00008335 [Chloebia gouldiae]